MRRREDETTNLTNKIVTFSFVFPARYQIWNPIGQVTNLSHLASVWPNWRPNLTPQLPVSCEAVSYRHGRLDFKYTKFPPNGTMDLGLLKISLRYTLAHRDTPSTDFEKKSHIFVLVV